MQMQSSVTPYQQDKAFQGYISANLGNVYNHSQQSLLK